MGIEQLLGELEKYAKENACEIYDYTRSKLGDIERYLGPQARVVEWSILDFRDFIRMAKGEDGEDNLSSFVIAVKKVARFPVRWEVYAKPKKRDGLDIEDDVLKKVGLAVFIYSMPYYNGSLDLWKLYMHPQLLYVYDSLKRIIVPREIVDHIDFSKLDVYSAKDYLNFLKKLYREIWDSSGGREFIIDFFNSEVIVTGLGVLYDISQLFFKHLPLAFSIYLLGRIISDFLMTSQLVEYTMNDKDFRVELFGKEEIPGYILLSANTLVSDKPFLYRKLARFLIALEDITANMRYVQNKNILAYHYIFVALAILEILRAVSEITKGLKITLTTKVLWREDVFVQTMMPSGLDPEKQAIVLANIVSHYAEIVDSINENLFEMKITKMIFEILEALAKVLNVVPKDTKKVIIPCFYRALFVATKKWETTNLKLVLNEERIRNILVKLKKHDKRAKKLLKLMPPPSKNKK